MKNFLIYTLATITGIILASLIFFFVMLGSLGAMVAAGDKPVSISDNSILVLKAGVPIPDRTDPNPFAGIDIMDMSFAPAAGLNDILKNLDKAAADTKIKGVLIENGLLTSGWATTEEIRNALDKFRETSGKFVIAWSDYVLQQEGYYLSTAADRIYIAPGSMVDFKGLSGDVMFYKKALEKLGVEVQVIRHGKFKGAVEPYILEELSKENEEQIRDYVGSIWNHAVEKMAVSRGTTAAELNRLADRLAGYVPTSALESRLVDGLIYRDALIDTIKILSRLTTDDKIELVQMTKYTKVPDPQKHTISKNKISVIYASGNIVRGKGNEYNIGGSGYADLIRKERLDSNVKAIVLRVNSPGGDAVASDNIWRELNLAAEVKPVVISMGNYAASGGYYISAPGTKIYSNPTTITGSIGVFGLIPNTGKFLEQKIGITTQSVNTNAYSDFPSPFRSMSVYEKSIMQMDIEHIYSTFTGKVALGRKMNVESVDSIGQGRVWGGSKALRLGLVDEIGGLKDAINGAASLAGVDLYSLRELPAVEDPYTKLLKQLTGEIRMRMLKQELGDYLRIYNDLMQLKDMEGVQARLPYFIEIH
ncbi:MAG: signal peptide peptidase SppA [Bacteroidota bacterium]